MKIATRRSLFIVILALITVSVLLSQHFRSRAVPVLSPKEARKGALPANQESLPASSQALALREKPAPRAGRPAPPFIIKGDSGVAYTVGGPRDRAVLLNFWASWCDPCRNEAPELNAIAEKYKDSLDIYGINVTAYDNKINAEHFAKKYKLAFPVMFDLKGDVYAKYNGTVFPTNVLIDRNGVVTEIILGQLTEEQLNEKLLKLMREGRL